MKKKQRAIISLVLILLLIGGVCLPAGAAVCTAQLEQAVQKSAVAVLKAVPDPQTASIGGEWAVIGLVRSGYAVPQSWKDRYYQNLLTQLKANKGVLHERKYTEYSRAVLALTAIGKDPTNVGGYNLLRPLGDFERTIRQGMNGPVWALIALDSADYAMPVNKVAKTQATRQMYIDEILSRQLNCGGWNLSDKGGAGQASADITGMVLQALAPYQQQPAVSAAVKKALCWLSVAQQTDGGYGSSSESIVQVMVGLCALGIDLEDVRFVKQGHTLLERLLTYQQTDGTFLHTGHGKGNDQMATEQGLYGLTAALRTMQGKSSLYDMKGDQADAAGKSSGGNGSVMWRK